MKQSILKDVEYPCEAGSLHWHPAGYKGWETPGEYHHACPVCGEVSTTRMLENIDFEGGLRKVRMTFDS